MSPPRRGFAVACPGNRAPVTGTRSGRQVHALDRWIGDIRTGRFERSMSALTAVGAVVTAGEIFFEHDRASFSNRLMWLPVVLGPVGAAAIRGRVVYRYLPEERRGALRTRR